MENQRDLTVNGVGNALGGQYYRVRLEGVAKVDGDLDCVALSTHGKVEIRGNVKAESAELHGMSQIEGHMEAEKVFIHGTSLVGGNLAGERIELNGRIAVAEHCEAETFEARGRFKIDGLLNVGTVEIFLHGRCRVKEIGGETIRVREMSLGSPFAEWFRFVFWPFRPRLIAETIEGDEIYLEHTKAKTVRGDAVTIGPGCEIDLVEFRDRFQKDNKAKVKTHRQV